MVEEINKKIIIKSEEDFHKWFIKNFKKLGYSKIIKHNKKAFPDFVLKKDNKILNVELEVLSSYFKAHKHNIEKTDEIICIKKDMNFCIPVIEITELRYDPRIRRLSATIDKKTEEILNRIFENGGYRNKSHVIEEAIRAFENVGMR